MRLLMMNREHTAQCICFDSGQVGLDALRQRELQLTLRLILHEAPQNSHSAVVQRRACSLMDTPKPGKVGTNMRPF